MVDLKTLELVLHGGGYSFCFLVPTPPVFSGLVLPPPQVLSTFGPLYAFQSQF